MNVNDRVTVKTDGERVARVWYWQLSSLMKARCIWSRWRTTRSGSGSLTSLATLTGFLLRAWSNMRVG